MLKNDLTLDEYIHWEQTNEKQRKKKEPEITLEEYKRNLPRLEGIYHVPWDDHIKTTLRKNKYEKDRQLQIQQRLENPREEEANRLAAEAIARKKAEETAKKAAEMKHEADQKRAEEEAKARKEKEAREKAKEPARQRAMMTRYHWLEKYITHSGIANPRTERLTWAKLNSYADEHNISDDHLIDFAQKTDGKYIRDILYYQ